MSRRGSPDPAEGWTAGLPDLLETFGHPKWFGRETGHNRGHSVVSLINRFHTDILPIQCLDNVFGDITNIGIKNLAIDPREHFFGVR